MPSASSACGSGLLGLTPYRRMIQGATIAPSTAIADSPTSVRVKILSASAQASSCPCLCFHSTNSGTKTDVRIPPSASSYRMLGVLLARL